MKNKSAMPLAAVIGHPVDHSLSPLIFSVLAAQERQPIDYRRVDVDPADFPQLARLMRKTGLFLGWNVTIPHKQAAARLCDTLSAEAKVVKAVNVVHFVRAPSGARAHGFNTDILGIERTLEAHRFPVRGARALVFGAGGAALAVGFALAKGGAREVIFANRTLARARAVARRLQAAPGGRGIKTKFRAIPWVASATLKDPVDLVVNATPLGMGAHSSPADGFPFPSSMKKGALAFDLIYVPENTPFLRLARKQGLSAIGGLDMLIWQAIATWEIWFGRLAPARKQKLKTALERALRTELRK